MNKKEVQQALDNATTKQELYVIGGRLNNLPEHIMIDKVTCMGFLDFDYAKQHVQNMIDTSKSLK